MKGVSVTSNDAVEARRREIQKRRKEQKLKRKKAALKRFFIFLCILLVITLAVLSLTVFFPVTKITVDNNTTIYTTEQIIKASGVQKGKNLWMTGFGAEGELPEKLPYISEVDVQRKFPSSIIIKAKPAKAVYSINNKKEYYICDADYKVLEIKKATDTKLISVLGIESNKTKAGNKVSFKDEQKMEILKSVFDGLEQKSITPNSIDLTEPMEIKVRVENRFNVYLGSSAYLEQKIAHLAGMINQSEKDVVGSIDLSDYSPENNRGILTRE